jgi:hypothetical protein
MTVIDRVVIQFAVNALNPVVGATAKRQHELKQKTRLVLRCPTHGLIGTLLDDGPASRALAERMANTHEESHQ